MSEPAGVEPVLPTLEDDDAPAAAPVVLPAWVKTSTCLTASCSDCGETYGYEDAGISSLHFAYLVELTKSLAEDAEGEDEEDVRFLVMGDELLCVTCRAARVCAARGHDWQVIEIGDARYSGCRRGCGETATKTDPTVPAPTKPGGVS